MSEIYTIGYTGFTINDFISTLKHYDINCVIDVRSLPLSSHYSDYNKSLLESLLRRHRIIYRNYSYEFGARQDNHLFYTRDYLDFGKFTASRQFLSGMEKIKQGMALGYKFVLMCAEKRPEVCHRNIMVARKFYENGHDVKNILSDGSIIFQDEIEKLLVDDYFPLRNQLSLFSDAPLSWEEMVAESYDRRNQEIAYRGEEEVERIAS